jgi:hypothetical protein
MIHAVSVLLLLAAQGCGETPEDAVRQTVADYYQGFIEERHDEVCERLTPRQRQRALDTLRERRPDLSAEERPDDCEGAVTILARDLPGPGEVLDPDRWTSPLRRLPSARVRIANDRATVVWPDDEHGFREPPGPRQLFKTRLRRLDGHWKLAGENEAESWP